MFNRGKYFLFQTVLILLSPITSFLVSLRYYKSSVSQFFFIIFAMYLGYYMGFVYDLMRHYMEIPMYYVGRDFRDITNDFRIYALGREPYHILLKYIFSRCTDSRQLGGAVASGLYAASFIFFFRQLKVFYNNKLPLFCTMLLLCVATVIEFYWYQGLRFWFGVYIFMGFYMKYLNSGKWWWLLCTPLVILIHYSLITLILVMLLNFALNFAGKYVRIGLLALSLFFKSLNIDFVPYMLYYFPWTAELGTGYSNEAIREKALDRMSTVRESGNLLYFNRLTIILIIAMFFLFVMKRCKAQFSKQYLNLFYLAMTLYTVSCFGYADLTFYGRFVKAAVLMLYTYVFITAAQSVRNWSRYNIMLFIIASAPFAYSFFMSFVQLRNFFFYVELIFGNFFVDWDGNALKMKYDWF